MKRKRLLVFLLIPLLASAIIGFALYKKVGSGKYTYLTGTVTAYDETPSYSDGGIFFQIDGRAVDIGGGLRMDSSLGEVYQPIQIGDKVQAKLISSESGYLTIYGCSECYVRRSD